MVSYVQSLSANFFSAYYRITTWPPQKKIRFFLLPVALGQICFVLVFDLIQSQSSKPVSRNGYSPN